MDVLLVEDDGLSRRLLERALTERGHRVDAFAEAEPALSTFEAKRHPICLIDWLLPGLSGQALCQRLRAGAADDLPVILVVTACDAADELGAILEAGASDYLQKPVSGGLLDVRLAVAERQVRLAETRKRAEQAFEKVQALDGLGALAGGVAHDFNNLLVGVLGNAGLALMDVPAGSPARASLLQIESAARRAADLCLQLLAYAGRGRLFAERVDLSALVRSSQDLFEASARGRASLCFDLADDLPAVEADLGQLRQAIVNLVVNAAESTEGRAVRATVRTGVLHADRAYLASMYVDDGLAPGRFVFFEVEDDGDGMDELTRRRLFDPFFSTKLAGRGLGLASVLGVVRSHKGAIEVASLPGRGTRVRFLLPALDGRADAVTVAPTSSALQSANVLLVDDDPGVREVTGRVLKALGFQVALASDGDEAIEVFRAREGWVDVVLLDMTMPRMPGERVFHALRALDPDVRVVVMSGFSEEEVFRRIGGPGLRGFLQKPFSPADLAQRLRAALQPAPPPPTLPGLSST